MPNANKSLEARVREAIRQLRDLSRNLETRADPAFTAKQINFLEKRLYKVRSLLEGDGRSPLYDGNTLHVHALLAKHRQIAAIWSIEDVQNVRPDLTDEQAWEVLEHVGCKHDAEWGITWVTLETVADDLFPQPNNT